MKIALNSTTDILTGRSNGNQFALRVKSEEPDLPPTITLVAPSNGLLVTSSWFLAVMENYSKSGITVELEGGTAGTIEEFHKARKRMRALTLMSREETAFKDIKKILERAFAGSDEFESRRKESGDDEFWLHDIFRALKLDEGGVELTDDVDEFYHVQLTRAELAGILVGLIDLSLGE